MLKFTLPALLFLPSIALAGGPPINPPQTYMNGASTLSTPAAMLPSAVAPNVGLITPVVPFTGSPKTPMPYTVTAPPPIPGVIFVDPIPKSTLFNGGELIIR